MTLRSNRNEGNDGLECGEATSSFLSRAPLSDHKTSKVNFWLLVFVVGAVTCSIALAATTDVGNNKRNEACPPIIIRFRRNIAAAALEILQNDTAAEEPNFVDIGELVDIVDEAGRL